MRDTRRKYKWFMEWNNGLLFISENGFVHFTNLIPNSFNGLLTLQELKPENYRGSDYFRLENESKRIAESTIKRKREKCMVII